MSLKSKIEAVIYASEEPVTLAQLVVLLSEEAQSELDALAARQADLFVSTNAEPGTAASDPAQATATDPAQATAMEAQPIEPGQADTPNLESEASSASDESSSDEDLPVATESAVDAESVSANAAAENVSGAGTAAEPASEQAEKRLQRERERTIREYLRGIIDTLMREYAEADRGLEIREVAGGFRFGTKPEYHDAVRGFVKSLKPALKLSLQALETLAVVAYKQPVTAAEISEIRGVDSAGVLGGLLTRKLIQTAGRKQVIGRPMLYKTSKEFLVRFGLRDIQELPSMEEFERMAGELAEQEDLPMEGTENIIERANARGDAEHIRQTNEAADSAEEISSPAEEAGETPDAHSQTTHEEASADDATAAADTSVSSDAVSSPRSEAEPGSEEQEPA